MKRVGLLLALLIASCGPLDDRDLWGNVYPPECAGTLDDVELPVKLVPTEQMPRKALGVCWLCGTPHSAWIAIDDRLNAVERRSAIKHEKCHRKLYLLGKPIEWHGERS